MNQGFDFCIQQRSRRLIIGKEWRFGGIRGFKTVDREIRVHGEINFPT